MAYSQARASDVFESVLEAAESPEDGSVIQIIFWSEYNGRAVPYIEFDVDRDDAIDGNRVNPELRRMVRQVLDGAHVHPFLPPLPVDLVDAFIINKKK